MAYENIRLRKQNVATVDGYFWMVDEDTDSIIVKTDDGTQAYSYPLDIPITQTVKSLEYDGRNIWTLRATATDQVTIDRWYINNYVCTRRNSFDFVVGPSHKYSVDAFTVEHYHIAFASNEAAGESMLSITDGTKLGSGYTIVLGPNASDQMEERTVSSAASDSVQINGSTSYAYEAGDPITFYKRLWLFNNYDGLDNTTGALYCVDAYTGSVITKYSGGAYKDVRACTFFDVPNYVFNRAAHVDEPKFNAICYIKGTNLIFLNPDDLTSSYGAMTMDNIRSDQATTIVVYDLAIEGTNIYRLQREATYYGVTATYADNTYNYQLSSLNSFITSISLRADPAILPANSTNTSSITAIVKDQFNLPIQGRAVTFTDDDTNGVIVTSPVNTDSDGIAVTEYRAGNTAREVRITSTAQHT